MSSYEAAIQRATDALGERANYLLVATPAKASRTFEYAEKHSTALQASLADLNSSILKTRSDSIMVTSTYQSKLQAFLGKLYGAHRVLEIGTYVGYSAMVWSSVTGPDGHVTTLEISPDMAEIAQRNLASQGVKNVEVLVGAASELLEHMEPELPYDLVFIDADKQNYVTYLELLLQRSQPESTRRLIAKGTLIIADNVLRYGHVAEEQPDMSFWPSESFKRAEIDGLRAFNEKVVNNTRLESVILPLWDGVNLMRLLD
ncbi:hypothetical protein NLG97_g332 [Lecanicillium saksenae]|uniref:Uncharacterized protein n=1 Tax=Lecanicillium saksenae TaxID=468837 RepID=A0ACC1R9J0_9HYPO|nr:hypothetical protein NLG97_g332 [Lecanicillium saksenae]